MAIFLRRGRSRKNSVCATGTSINVRLSPSSVQRLPRATDVTLRPAPHEAATLTLAASVASLLNQCCVGTSISL